MLKCAEIVVEIESELEETTADEADDEELLRDAVGRSEVVLAGEREEEGHGEGGEEGLGKFSQGRTPQPKLAKARIERHSTLPAGHDSGVVISIMTDCFSKGECVESTTIYLRNKSRCGRKNGSKERRAQISLSAFFESVLKMSCRNAFYSSSW